MRLTTEPLANGETSAYALTCGYVERTTVTRPDGGETWLELWQPSPGNRQYDVRRHDFDGDGRRYWEAFDTLTEARRFYRRKRTELRREVAP